MRASAGLDDWAVLDAIRHFRYATREQLVAAMPGVDVVGAIERLLKAHRIQLSGMQRTLVGLRVWLSPVNP